MKSEISRKKALQYLRDIIRWAEAEYKRVGLKISLDRNYSCGEAQYRPSADTREIIIGVHEISDHVFRVPFDEFCFACVGLNHEIRHAEQTTKLVNDPNNIPMLISYLSSQGNPIFYRETYAKNYSEIDAVIHSVVETQKMLTEDFPEYDTNGALLKLFKRMSEKEATRFTSGENIETVDQLLISIYKWEAKSQLPAVKTAGLGCKPQGSRPQHGR